MTSGYENREIGNEDSRKELREKVLKRKPSSGKRTRESQVDSIHSSATRGRRQCPTRTGGSGRGIST